MPKRLPFTYTLLEPQNLHSVKFAPHSALLVPLHAVLRYLCTMLLQCCNGALAVCLVQSRLAAHCLRGLHQTHHLSHNELMIDFIVLDVRMYLCSSAVCQLYIRVINQMVVPIYAYGDFAVVLLHSKLLSFHVHIVHIGTIVFKMHGLIVLKAFALCLSLSNMLN